MDQKCDFTFGWDFEVLQSASKVLDQKVDQSTRMNITNRLLCYLCLSIFVWGFFRSKLCVLSWDQPYQSNLYPCLSNFKFNGWTSTPSLTKMNLTLRNKKNLTSKKWIYNRSNLEPPLRWAKFLGVRKSIFLWNQLNVLFHYAQIGQTDHRLLQFKS